MNRSADSAEADAALIRAFQSGEGAAFDKLVLKHKDRVFNLVYWFVGDYQEANDCAQDTFIKVYKSLKAFRFESAFSTWRFRDAKSVTYDYLDPTPTSVIQDLARAIAKSRAKRVLVYGDGDIPDTGEQLGKEISSHGIKNVFYAKGGDKALQSMVVPGGDR